MGDQLQRFANLSVINLPVHATRELAGLAQRNMQLQCTVSEGTCWLADDTRSVQVEPMPWKRAEDGR